MKLYRSEISYVMFFNVGFKSLSFFSNMRQIPAKRGGGGGGGVAIAWVRRFKEKNLLLLSSETAISFFSFFPLFFFFKSLTFHCRSDGLIVHVGSCCLVISWLKQHDRVLSLHLGTTTNTIKQVFDFAACDSRSRAFSFLSLSLLSRLSLLLSSSSLFLFQYLEKREKREALFPAWRP